MESSVPEIAFPTLEQIVEVNRRMIEESGGSFTPPTNLRNANALIYILSAIRFPIFGHIMFDSMKEKAAALSYEIIASHVFVDGNKRTGIHAGWMFLRANDIQLYLDGSIEDLAVNLAEGIGTREDLLDWFHQHQND